LVIDLRSHPDVLFVSTTAIPVDSDASNSATIIADVDVYTSFTMSVELNYANIDHADLNPGLSVGRQLGKFPLALKIAAF
jgi:hypothetical protein